MKILAPNSSTIVVTSMIGESIPVNNVNIIVGPDTYNASGIEDKNHNGRWDEGETIFLYGLNLSGQTSVVVSTDTTVLLPGTVGVSNNGPPSPEPSTPPGGGTFTSYRPGIRMFTFAGPSFVSPTTSKIVDSVSYADPDAVAVGYHTDDRAWPLSEAARAHNFSVRFEGYLYVDDNATYDIRMTMTDSACIAIDGGTIMNNTGERAPYCIISSVYLTTGYHAVEIGYENYNNNSALIGELFIRKQTGIAWEQPGLFYLESVTT